MRTRMTKNLILIGGVVMLSGCTTVSNLTEKLTGVSCEKQVEISIASIEATADSLMQAFNDNVISRTDKDKAIDELQLATDELFILNNNCKTDPDAAKARAEELEIK